MIGKISEILEKKNDFFFTFFNASGYFGVFGNFLGGGRGQSPLWRLKATTRRRGPWGLNVLVYIYIYNFLTVGPILKFIKLNNLEFHQNHNEGGPTTKKSHSLLVRGLHIYPYISNFLTVGPILKF